MTRTLEVEFGAINNDNVEQLRKVNTVSFPVTYNEGFYQDVVKRNNEHLNKFAYYNGFVVGAVCTRIEPLTTNHTKSSSTVSVTSDENTSNNNDKENTSTDPANGGGGKVRLYIMTLAVLAAYRGRGIGAQLIQSVLDYCEQINSGNLPADAKKDASVPQRIDEIALHVQISNEDAIRFYTQKFGFEQGAMVENYYRRIDPPHCYILSKKLV